MELYKHCFALITLILPTLAAMVFSDNFTEARKKINETKPNIDYPSFCAEMNAGEDKIACRVKDVPSVGFLVCKKPEIEGTNCRTIINTEVENIQKVQKEGSIKTVTISPPPIDGVKCGNDLSTRVVQWLSGRMADHRQGKV